MFRGLLAPRQRLPPDVVAANEHAAVQGSASRVDSLVCHAVYGSTCVVACHRGTCPARELTCSERCLASNLLIASRASHGQSAACAIVCDGGVEHAACHVATPCCVLGGMRKPLVALGCDCVLGGMRKPLVALGCDCLRWSRAECA